MGVERVARITSIGYESPRAASDTETRWVQIDLGAAHSIEAVKLFPHVDWGGGAICYPIRLRVDVSDDPGFASSRPIVDKTAADVPGAGDAVGVYRAQGVSGRYVRLTVTKMNDRHFVLSRMEVWSNGRDVAVGCAVADSLSGELGKTRLTRQPRPQGEEVVTDNPGNVITVDRWKPVPDRVTVPRSGVRLDEGLFKTAMRNNIGYLLSSFTADEMLRQFRERAGKPIGTGLRNPDGFWDSALAGSSAGRFLMGAGNTLRWMDDPELRRRMNYIVDTIAECRQPDGYIMAYPENTIFYNERGAYTRAWLTHGLIEAGFSGNAKAFDLLRTNYNWFDHNPYLPELLRRAGQGVQGMIANTGVYFTPIGKPEDLQVIQRYFQEDYWLDQLGRRDPAAIWQYPYDHPHNYLLTSIEPYMDLYRATGERRYLDAAAGGWKLYHNNWEHVGGTIAICESDAYPPKSYFLHRHTGELCGSVFWTFLNQRFHKLYPDQEKYVAEIEKSIYNAALANQVGSQTIRYHANLVGHKENGDHRAINSCCEGQGTRMLGALPEFIYSVAKDGLYVNLYAPSSISWKLNGRTFGAHMATGFPTTPHAAIRISVSSPARADIRIRVPSWAAAAMPIRVNGKKLVDGKPGTYAELKRVWANGDTISFTLPMAFRLTRYNGMEQTPGQDRYALEYGPVLMAAVSTTSTSEEARLPMSPDTLVKSLRPLRNEPLRFSIPGDPQHRYIPYYQVGDETFTCYPVLAQSGSLASVKPGPGDLALASKGAVATSDSELDREPNGTAKVIDGIIAAPGDFSNRWHSSIATAHPHWVEVKLAKPNRIGRVEVWFADPEGYPVSFRGVARVNGTDVTLFDVRDNANWRNFKATFAPVTTDTFRLIIRASANPNYPNAAQLSEIAIYAR